nr:tyrosine-type recombinase/integrase [Burkholderia cenocepacia]
MYEKGTSRVSRFSSGAPQAGQIINPPHHSGRQRPIVDSVARRADCSAAVIVERDVRDGVVWIRQNKTGTRLRIEVVGELSTLLGQLAIRKTAHNPRSTRLIVDEQGRPLGRAALRFRFDRAREAAGIAKDAFQFRDLRAKAGTDKESTDSIREAQALLGHGSVAMTEHYVRKRGVKITPTR